MPDAAVSAPVVPRSVSEASCDDQDAVLQARTRCPTRTVRLRVGERLARTPRPPCRAVIRMRRPRPAGSCRRRRRPAMHVSRRTASGEIGCPPAGRGVDAPGRAVDHPRTSPSARRSAVTVSATPDAQPGSSSASPADVREVEARRSSSSRPIGSDRRGLGATLARRRAREGATGSTACDETIAPPRHRLDVASATTGRRRAPGAAPRPPASARCR